jgi:hypothetical protein
MSATCTKGLLSVGSARRGQCAWLGAEAPSTHMPIVCLSLGPRATPCTAPRCATLTPLRECLFANQCAVTPCRERHEVRSATQRNAGCMGQTEATHSLTAEFANQPGQFESIPCRACAVVSGTTRRACGATARDNPTMNERRPGRVRVRVVVVVISRS